MCKNDYCLSYMELIPYRIIYEIALVLLFKMYVGPPISFQSIMNFLQFMSYNFDSILATYSEIYLLLVLMCILFNVLPFI